MFYSIGHARLAARSARMPIWGSIDTRQMTLLDAGSLDWSAPAQFTRQVDPRAAHEPHRIALYLGDLAAAFNLWNRETKIPGGAS